MRLEIVLVEFNEDEGKKIRKRKRMFIYKMQFKVYSRRRRNNNFMLDPTKVLFWVIY